MISSDLGDRIHQIHDFPRCWLPKQPVLIQKSHGGQNVAPAVRGDLCDTKAPCDQEVGDGRVQWKMEFGLQDILVYWARSLEVGR